MMNNHALLTALAGRRIFIVYRLVPAENGKLDKVPTNPRTGGNIDSQDSSNWLLPDEATEHVEALNLMPLPPGVTGYGVGLVVHPDLKLFFLDLDSCREGAGWQPHAVAFLNRFPAAMREVSVSGNGLHVFGSYAGERPLHRVKNADYKIELYTGGRFAALGHSESGDIFADCTTELHPFIEQFFPPRAESEHGDEWRTEPVAQWRGPQDDDDLLARAMRSQGANAAFNGRASFADLWNCNVEVLARSFPSVSGRDRYDGSSADFALFNHLAYWSGSHHERMLRLAMREDCKLRRDKWTAREGNYLRPTILRACADQTEWYKGPRTEPAVARAPVVVEAPVTSAGTIPTVASVPTPPKLSFKPPTQAPHVLTHDSKNKYEATLQNLIHVLGLQQICALGFDTFRGQIMVAPPGGGDWRSVVDVDMVNLREVLGLQNFAAIGKEMMRDALMAVAERNSYDSAVVWLNGLVWDGVPRIDNFLHVYCGAEDDEYTRAVSRYIWSGLPCRVFEPGCQLDMVPAFQSRQGGRKSSGLLALSPSKDFFTDSVSFARDDEKFSRAIRGKLVIEIPELAGLSKAEVEFVKRMITRRDERWTEKWQVIETCYPRRGMMFASTNNLQFLPQDPTGQRRWLPVEIERINDVLITRDRDQLWAEGKVRWQQLKDAGLPGVDFSDAERLAAGRHAKYEQDDVWELKIAQWLETPLEIPGQTLRPAPCTRPLDTSEILGGAIGMEVERQNKQAATRVGVVMRKLGYERRTVRLPGVAKPVERWVPKEDL